MGSGLRAPPTPSRLPPGLEQHLKEHKNSPIEQMTMGSPSVARYTCGGAEERSGKWAGRRRGHAPNTAQQLTSVAIIHSSFSSDITNTDLYLVSAHADGSGALFSDASLQGRGEKVVSSTPAASPPALAPGIYHFKRLLRCSWNSNESGGRHLSSQAASSSCSTSCTRLYSAGGCRPL